jgi:hypothetical protein
MCCGGIADVIFAKVKCNGAVGYWQSGCGVEKATAVAVATCVVCHCGIIFFDMVRLLISRD